MTKAMHILLAPDSFKGTLTSRQVIEALTQAAAELLPTAVLTPIPIADGGEGTVEAMAAAAGGQLHEQSVTGPLGEPRQACWALLPDGVCVVEMAQASGLPLVWAGAPPTTLGWGCCALLALVFWMKAAASCLR